MSKESGRATSGFAETLPGLFQSLASASMALPVVGMQQMAGLLRGTEASGRDAIAALDGITEQALHGMSPMFASAFALGDRMQRNLAEMALSPSAVAIATRDAMERAVEGWRTMAAGDANTAIQELRNKITIYLLMMEAGKIIDVPDEPPLPLRELLDRCYELDDYRALWAVEGLGQRYGDSIYDLGETPVGILGAEKAPDLPARSLTMLHAGVGLAFARRLLGDLAPDSSEAEAQAVVSEFVRLCDENARAGHVGAALEALGMQTWTYHAWQLTPLVGRALQAAVPEAVPYFWHGVGRAIYFDMPASFLPCADWTTFETGRRVAPEEASLANVWAGSAWACTMVNLKTPEVLADLLLKSHGEELASNGGFTNGVVSSMMVRRDTTPDSSLIDSFLRHEPGDADPDLARWWRELVTEPCERAINETYPAIRKKKRLGELFAYQDFED